MSFLNRPIFEWLIRHPTAVGHNPILMGILNVTPDSFSGDGLLRRNKRSFIQAALLRARWMIKHGATIIDVGGESTRPGSEAVDPEEEQNRVLPVVAALAKSLSDGWISVDTVKPAVAKEALSLGAHIINTIRGLDPDPDLLETVARYRAGLVLTHMRGVPKTMQQTIHFHDCVKEVFEELETAIAHCVRAGLDPRQIAVDPGLGFGKTAEHNLELIRHIHRFHELKRPILIGASRKSFIGAVLKRDVNHRLWGTAAVTAWCAMAGVHIHRVHDVAAMHDVITMIEAIRLTASQRKDRLRSVNASVTKEIL